MLEKVLFVAQTGLADQRGGARVVLWRRQLRIRMVEGARREGRALVTIEVSEGRRGSIGLNEQKLI